MGHLLHGSSLALFNQVLMYGVRTVSGSTGGVSDEAAAIPVSTAAVAAYAAARVRIV